MPPVSDPHLETAMRLYNTPAESVTPEQRKLAKNVNLAEIYGGNIKLKKFGLGFSISNEMLCDDLYSQQFKVKHMKQNGFEKLDPADRSAMRMLGMDEYSYLTYMYDAIVGKKYLTVPEEEELMQGQANAVQNAKTAYGNVPGAGVQQGYPPISQPTAGMHAPTPSSQISNYSADVNSVVAEMASQRDRLNNLRNSLVSTDPRDPSHMHLANEIASTFRSYAELSDRLIVLTA